MPNHEKLLAELLGLATFGFLSGFWFLPGGVLALRRRALGEPQVDVRPGYSPETLYRLLRLYGPEGIRSFRRMLHADMVFPAVYGALFFVLGDLTASAHPTALRAAGGAQIMGVTAAGFDYIENILLLFVLRRLPRQHLYAARAAGICTSLKTLSLIAALGALVSTCRL
jgi:hypothetical protein